MLQVIDLDNRIIGGSFVSERPIERWSWQKWEPFWLIWDTSRESVDTTRVANGVAPFLNNHDDGQEELGGITSVEFGDQELLFEAKIDNTEAGNLLIDRVQNRGVGVSVGSMVTEMVEESPAVYEIDANGYETLVEWPVYRATRWEIIEISKATIPANPDVGGTAQNASAQAPIQELQKIDGSRQNARYVGEGTWVELGAYNASALANPVDAPKLVRPSRKVSAKAEDSENDSRGKTNSSDGAKKLMTQKLETQNAELQQQVSDLQSELAGFQSSEQNAKAELEAAKTQLTEAQQQNAELTGELNTLKAEIEKDRHQTAIATQVHDLHSQAVQLQSEFKLNKTEVDSLFGDDIAAKVEQLATAEDAPVQLAEIRGQLKAYASRQPKLNSVQNLTSATDVATPDEKQEASLQTLSEAAVEKARAYARKNIKVKV